MVLQKQVNRTVSLGSSNVREQCVLPGEDLLFPLEAKTSRNGVWVGQALSEGDSQCPFSLDSKAMGSCIPGPLRGKVVNLGPLEQAPSTPSVPPGGVSTL